jgi:hypothetical protein
MSNYIGGWLCNAISDGREDPLAMGALVENGLKPVVKKELIDPSWESLGISHLSLIEYIP